LEVVEELAVLKSLHGTTTGEDLYLNMSETTKKREMP
jgi:hypothetical protein